MDTSQKCDSGHRLAFESFPGRTFIKDRLMYISGFSFTLIEDGSDLICSSSGGFRVVPSISLTLLASLFPWDAAVAQQKWCLNQRNQSITMKAITLSL